MFRTFPLQSFKHCTYGGHVGLKQVEVSWVSDFCLKSVYKGRWALRDIRPLSDKWMLSGYPMKNFVKPVEDVMFIDFS